TLKYVITAPNLIILSLITKDIEKRVTTHRRLLIGRTTASSAEVIRHSWPLISVSFAALKYNPCPDESNTRCLLPARKVELIHISRANIQIIGSKSRSHSSSS